MRTGNIQKVLSPTRLKLIASAIIASSIGIILLKIQPSSALPNGVDVGVHLSIVPSSPTVTSGQTTTLSLYAHPHGHRLTAAQLSIDFDPTKFTASTSAIQPGPHLSQLLPNCQNNQPPCLPQTNVDTNSGQLTAVLGVSCTNQGCHQAPTDQSYLLATLTLTAQGSAGNTDTISFNTQDIQGSITQLAASGYSENMLDRTTPSTLSITLCQLLHDFIPDGRVTVADIQRANNTWNTSADSGDYNGQFDLNGDHRINLSDIQSIANSWGQQCQ